jgi:hypothetical protein
MSVYFSAFVGTFFFLLLNSCGNLNQSNSVSSQKGSKPIFNSKDSWKILSKKCGSVEVPRKPFEAYKIDDSHLVIIQKLSEDASSLCKIGYVYDRVITSFNATISTYQETSILRSFMAKKTCWKKVEGKTIQPPDFDKIIEFGPEEKNFKLTVSGVKASIELPSPAECSTGPLLIELQK